MFAEVVGISLGSPCVFRFRRKAGGKWERASVVAEPRSAYLLQGPSRTDWEHRASRRWIDCATRSPSGTSSPHATRTAKEGQRVNHGAVMRHRHEHVDVPRLTCCLMIWIDPE
jgi:hypothetical protein